MHERPGQAESSASRFLVLPKYKEKSKKKKMNPAPLLLS
jgi:hypothetical protein